MMQISISHWSLVSQRPDTNTKNLANVKRDWTKNKCVGLEWKFTVSSVLYFMNELHMDKQCDFLSSF